VPSSVGDTLRCWGSEMYCAMAPAVSHRSVTMETRVRYWVSKGIFKVNLRTGHEGSRIRSI